MILRALFEDFYLVYGKVSYWTQFSPFVKDVALANFADDNTIYTHKKWYK